MKIVIISRRSRIARHDVLSPYKMKIQTLHTDVPPMMFIAYFTVPDVKYSWLCVHSTDGVQDYLCWKLPTGQSSDRRHISGFVWFVYNHTMFDRCQVSVPIMCGVPTIIQSLIGVRLKLDT